MATAAEWANDIAGIEFCGDDICWLAVTASRDLAFTEEEISKSLHSAIIDTLTRLKEESDLIQERRHGWNEQE